MPVRSLEVADIFRAHGAAWRAAKAGHISLDQLKVMSAIERCRTAALGGHVTRCEDCTHEHIAYNSGWNRHCPKCQAGAAKAWLAAREAELLPVRYFHLVFTLPKPIADIAHQNKRAFYNLLMRASADTVVKIAAGPKHLGTRAGMISVLHTWGSAMTHHPHVHMIVPGGGLSADGSEWIVSRKNFFLSVRALSRLYRRLILDGLVKLHKAEKLHFFGEHAELDDRATFDTFLQPLRKIDWVVYAKEPFAGPKAVLAYQSRYTHRVAISNSRLIRFDAQCHLPRQRLPSQRRGPTHHNDFSVVRVHPPVPDPRPAQRSAPHPPLRGLRKPLPGRRLRSNLPRGAIARPISPRSDNCWAPKHRIRIAVMTTAPAIPMSRPVSWHCLAHVVAAS